MFMKFSLNCSLTALATSGLLTAAIQLPIPALAVTTWDWSFTSSIADQFGSGTFTTADVTPTAFTTYDIIGISGTYNRAGTSFTISSLDNSPGGPNVNKFQWDGTIASKILAYPTFYDSIAFVTTGGKVALVKYATGGVGAVDYTSTNIFGVDGPIATSNLSPRNPVPGPLPVLGIATGLTWSRRLRQRLRTSTSASTR
jgi:hypothetical protein